MSSETHFCKNLRLLSVTDPGSLSDLVEVFMKQVSCVVFISFIRLAACVIMDMKNFRMLLINLFPFLYRISGY